MFAEKGYAKTSIEQIARQASLSVGAIYLYFRSKEDLYVSLLEETFEMFGAELDKIETRTDLHPGDRLQAAWLFFAQWAVSDLEGSRTLRILSQPGLRKQLSDEVAEGTARGLASIRDHLARLVAGGIDARLYNRVFAPVAVADLLWSIFLGLLQTNDIRINLDLPGESFTETARTALATFEASLRQPARLTAEAA